MTSTTIKVSPTLRDQLKSQAQGHGRTLGDHLQALADREERYERFRRLRQAMTEHPPDEEYRAEERAWLGDGWI